MDGGAAIERVRERLEMTFGRALALLIMASASNEVGCSTVCPNPDEFNRLIESICRDQRVIDMWGLAGAADALSSWKQAIAS